MTIQDSIRQRLAGAEEAKLKAKTGKKKKLQVIIRMNIRIYGFFNL